MVVIYECAEDLGIDSLMEFVLYTIVWGSEGWESLLKDRVKLGKLVEKIFTLTAEEERVSHIYKSFFRLIIAMIQQEGLMSESWFLELLGKYKEFGIELLKASFKGADGTGVIECLREGCGGVVGEWKKCQVCSGSVWDDNFDEW
ncbi:hypothetical protein ABW20_dc0107485 [Dactylellina cionopaga]|nr:hypothetical protein ABW20_dc0107485 [Dactylellina cionopaga]